MHWHWRVEALLSPQPVAIYLLPQITHPKLGYFPTKVRGVSQSFEKVLEF